MRGVTILLSNSGTLREVANCIEMLISRWSCVSPTIRETTIIHLVSVMLSRNVWDLKIYTLNYSIYSCKYLKNIDSSGSQSIKNLRLRCPDMTTALHKTDGGVFRGT